jgi:hypothetical protein
MKLKLCACLALGALMINAQASAAPLFTPFLSVDINAYNAGGGQTIGPTAAGFQGWEMAEGLFLDPSIDWPGSGAAGLTKVFSTGQGNITANLQGVVPNATRGARNRGANTDVLGDLTSDFVFAQRDGAIGFGRNYVRVQLSGLAPNQTYEITAWARDHFNGGADSFQAWSDISHLGGVDGPSAWLDANVGAGASYQPAVGGTLNPIPTWARSAVSGPAGADAYTYAATFPAVSNGSGVAVFYGWTDANSFSGVQGAALLNGFTVGLAPEPASAGLFAMALLGLSNIRRRLR